MLCITNMWKDGKHHISDPAVKWVCVFHHVSYKEKFVMYCELVFFISFAYIYYYFTRKVPVYMYLVPPLWHIHSTEIL
jgi:hypothetical protein